ncbi:lysine exporter LysE [Thermacetogenium phaeum DSM 12270]|uniref:Lysine exporter LysE n=1 Tax=Thermacetogenium phaeum (strain ATCC BAA-254 / DSM 26808 / PB) TaxID=1089553 RepID=K4LGV9_THEPS|nr:LysE family transporter [Thermacetogenium phaeum]AFV11205.1 lysine exporter LysE [Thermacetogenium phaeum DSM 12270]
MELTLIFLTSFLIAMSGAMMPGPMLAVTVKESLQEGWPAGVFISIGHGLTEVLLIGLFVLGLGRVLQAQWISAVVGVAGGLVLLLMGVDMIAGALKEKQDLALTGEGVSGTGGGCHQQSAFWRILGAGIVVSMANPTWIIWWLTIGMLYVTQALKFGWVGIGLFYSGHFLADFAWYVLVAVLIATGKKFLSVPVYRWIMAVCGLLVVVLALLFTFQGFQAAVQLF